MAALADQGNSQTVRKIIWPPRLANITLQATAEAKAPISSASDSKINPDKAIRPQGSSIFNTGKQLAPLVSMRGKTANEAHAKQIARVQNARLISALKTPYTWAGKVDIIGFDRLLSEQAEKGV